MAPYGKLWQPKTCQEEVKRKEKLNTAYAQIVKAVMIWNIFDFQKWPLKTSESSKLTDNGTLFLSHEETRLISGAE